MLGPVAMLTAAGGSTGCTGVSPAAPPTSVSLYGYGADLTGIQWTTGDSNAFTQLGQSDSEFDDPTSVFALVGVGQTTAETGETCTCYWYVRHLRNCKVTAWVLAFGCVEGEECL